ncbi:MAG: SBBP repeat-containing protein [Syntrophaceae bacterium]
MFNVLTSIVKFFVYSVVMIFLLTGCGGGGGGGDNSGGGGGEQLSSPVINLSGTWVNTETTETNTCGESVGSQETSIGMIMHTTGSNSFTVYDNGLSYTGTISGTHISYSGQADNSNCPLGQNVTFSLDLQAPDYTTATGYVDWTCKYQGGSCSGTSYVSMKKKWTQLGTTSDDVGRGVAVDASGNVFVTGVTLGSLDGNTNAGYSDIFLVKYDAAGGKQWTRQLGTTNYDYSQGVAVDTNGNVYVTGYTSGSLDGNTNAGGTDIFLVKYDAAGTKQWTRQLGSSSDERAQGVAVDTNGDLYVTGYTSGSLDGNTKAGGIDIFLVKYDAAGTKQWTRQLGSSSNDIAQGVAVDTSGNIYVTGSTNGSLDGNTNAGNYDMFLVKYNAAGTKQWTRQLGSSSDDEATGVAVDTNGNLYVTGKTNGSLDGNTSAGNYDMFLVKYNAAGAKQWTRQLGTSTTDYGQGVAVDASGNIYVTGSTYGGLDGNTSSGDSYDMFLVKYNAAGAKQWTRQLGMDHVWDEGNGVTVDIGGNVYVTGYTDWGLGPSGLNMSKDVFIVKYNANGIK